MGLISEIVDPSEAALVTQLIPELELSVKLSVYVSQLERSLFAM